MTREEARIAARQRLGEYLEKLGIDTNAAAGSGSRCPICGYGEKSPCFHYYKPERWTCFSRCGSGDIFDLYAALNGIADKGEAMSAVYRELGLTVEAGAPSPTGRKEGEAARPIPPPPPPPIRPAPAGDFVSFYMEAASHIEEPEAIAYLEKRGISLETANAYGLGYMAAWRSPKVPAAVPTSPRLIIPRGRFSYLARDIRATEEIPEAARKYVKQQAKVEGADMELFNMRTLEDNGISGDARPVYIVEGEIDALSIIEAGGAALGLGSKGNYKRVLLEVQRLKEKYNSKLETVGGLTLKAWDPRVVVALDADGKTAEETKALVAGLEALHVEVMAADTAALYAGAKDANEALVKDRSGFSARLITTLQAYDFEKANAAASVTAEYIGRYAAAGYKDLFFSEVLNTERELIASGYPSLDRAISGWNGGGLPAGLYVLGAISSLGKTTFILQMADQMAAAGRDVLIFSLEMSRYELMGKSISRISLLKAREKSPRAALELLADSAYTWSDIRDMKRKITSGILSSAARDNVEAAAEEYFSKIAPHVFIEEGSLNGTSMEMIAGRVREHVEKTGVAPVVFIDYLQMIAPPANMETASDKTLTDHKIRACKVLSRDYKTPVLAISSFNRESYYKPVSLTSFKESGSIEYTADIVLGLQYPAMEKLKGKDNEVEGARIESEIKSADVRDVEVKILKNRSGGMSQKPVFKFYAKYNYFSEVVV